MNLRAFPNNGSENPTRLIRNHHGHDTLLLRYGHGFRCAERIADIFAHPEILGGQISETAAVVGRKGN